MSKNIEITVPDIGDFDQVDVIDVMVHAGDRVDKEGALITLETEKAVMDVPSTHAGVIKQVKVSVGDKVSEGDAIATLTVEEDAAASGQAKAAPAEAEAAAAQPAPES